MRKNLGRYAIAIDQAQQKLESCRSLWQDRCGEMFLMHSLEEIGDEIGKLCEYQEQLGAVANETMASVPVEDLNTLIRNAFEFVERN
ncbi:MAG: hypothetical protein ACI4MI_02865 [Christensenellales bacterium]